MRLLVSGENNMKQKQVLLSGVIITKNEHERLAACIQALRFCDEVVVLDNGSEDDTVEIARHHGAVVHSLPDGDFAQMRNYAKEHVRGKWLLYIDADEIVTQELADQIVHAVHDWKSGNPDVYALHRKNYYLGFLWPTHEWMTRLFRVPALIEWKGAVHETPITLGPVGKLSAYLLHDTHRNLEQMVQKTNEWSKTEAKLRFDAGHPKITWWRFIRVMMTGFWQSYITQGGWKAGAVGWIESIFQAFSMFVTYAKLWELQNDRK